MQPKAREDWLRKYHSKPHAEHEVVVVVTEAMSSPAMKAVEHEKTVLRSRSESDSDLDE